MRFTEHYLYLEYPAGGSGRRFTVRPIRFESHGTGSHRVFEVIHTYPWHSVIPDRENCRHLLRRDHVGDESPQLPPLDLVWRPKLYRMIHHACSREAISNVLEKASLQELQ